jgi:hypothetical protein
MYHTECNEQLHTANRFQLLTSQLMKRLPASNAREDLGNTILALTELLVFGVFPIVNEPNIYKTMFRMQNLLPASGKREAMCLPLHLKP